MENSKVPELLVAPCSHEAAKYAVLKWHYSKAMPYGKSNRFGVWEGKEFVGVVIFSYGASAQLGRPYDLYMGEVVELTRVALRPHGNPVSRILAISIRMLKKHNPGLRLLVSYSDLDQDHLGIIYQATNWTYVGVHTKGQKGVYYIVNGKKIHNRTIKERDGWECNLGWLQKNIDPGARYHISKGKHKYLYPLDEEIRERVLPKKQAYPKRAGSIEGDASTPPGGGGTFESDPGAPTSDEIITTPREDD